MDGRIMRHGIISSCQSAATSEIVKRCCSSLVSSAITSTRTFTFSQQILVYAWHYSGHYCPRITRQQTNMQQQRLAECYSLTLPFTVQPVVVNTEINRKLPKTKQNLQKTNHKTWRSNCYILILKLEIITKCIISRAGLGLRCFRTCTKGWARVFPHFHFLPVVAQVKNLPQFIWAFPNFSNHTGYRTVPSRWYRRRRTYEYRQELMYLSIVNLHIEPLPLPRPTSRTKKFQSFINFALNNYQSSM